MIPWNRLPQEAQKTILALVLMSGSSTVSGCCAPVICDPAPPPMTWTPTPPSAPTAHASAALPSQTPRATPPPIICDPAPPPSLTPRRPASPIICDPPPPPATSRTPRPAPTATIVRRFQIRLAETTLDSTLKTANVRGTVVDRQGKPLGGMGIALQKGPTAVRTWTDHNGAFRVDAAPGSWLLTVSGDHTQALSLDLEPGSVATVECVEVGPTSRAPLPLAEIRTVDIVWSDDATFRLDSPWTGAQHHWSVSGGSLQHAPDHVAWQPPAEPGRYLLQVIADWGPDGMAVDSLVLTVDPDGNISFG